MPLESLPPELKIILMSTMPDVSSLRNLTRASPVYHQTYVGARESIFHNMTALTLYDSNVSTLEAWTAINAPQIDHFIAHRKAIITEFLDRYGDGLTDGRQRFTVEESLAVLSLHRKMTTLVDDYCTQILNQNPNTLTTSDKANIPKASSAELRRLYRAFYRYEIYCKLFCAVDLDEHYYRFQVQHNLFDEVALTEIFVKLFPVHEVEELACMHNYAQECYKNLVPGMLSSPILGFRHRVDAVHNFTSRGPSFLYRVLMTETPRERLAFCEASRHFMPEIKIRNTLNAYQQVLETGHWPWKGINDSGSSERLPTAGWVWASKRGVENVDFNLRKWGYVFWDQKRLEDWDIKEDTILNWSWPVSGISRP